MGVVFCPPKAKDRNWQERKTEKNDFKVFCSFYTNVRERIRATEKNNLGRKKNNVFFVENVRNQKKKKKSSLIIIFISGFQKFLKTKKNKK